MTLSSTSTKCKENVNIKIINLGKEDEVDMSSDDSMNIDENQNNFTDYNSNYLKKKAFFILIKNRENFRKKDAKAREFRLRRNFLAFEQGCIQSLEITSSQNSEFKLMFIKKRPEDAKITKLTKKRTFIPRIKSFHNKQKPVASSLDVQK